MLTTDELTNTYEFGWNITRNVLLNKQTRIISTIFGNRISNECDLFKDIEAERLHRKYSMMAMRNEKREYCDGALDLIREWDRIGRAPKPLLEFETGEYDSGEGDEN